MGSFLFKWAHPATEVYVTGTFDDWGRTQKLEKTDGIFQKVVDLPAADAKIFYKFVVDENWTTDHTAPIEKDEIGNTNNVLLPEHIIKKSTGTVGGPTSDLPGAFPETPALTSENQAFNVNPIPATAGVGNPVSLRPGEKVPDASTLTSNTVGSTVTTSKEDYEKSASGAPVLPNPLTPEANKGAGMFGLPEQRSNLIPESSLPIGAGAATEAPRDPGVMISGGGGAPTTAGLAGAVPLEPKREATTVEGGAQNLATTSTGGGATTAALAGPVPVEPRGTASTVDSSAFGTTGSSTVTSGFAPGVYRGDEANTVPTIVQDSQAKAGVSPEASANPEAVAEKSAVESELEKSVPTQSATSGETSVGAKVAEIAGGAAAGATAAVAAIAAFAGTAKDKVQSGEAKEQAKETAAQAQTTASEYAGQAQSAATQAKDSAASAASQAQDTAAPYAAQAQSAAVQAKDSVVSSAGQAQEAAAPYANQAKEAVIGATAATTAAAAATAASAKSYLPESVQRAVGATDGTGDAPAAPAVPATVKDSLATAHEPAEGATNPVAVSQKAAVERELHDTVLPEQAIDEPPGSGVPPTVGTSGAVPSASSATAPAVPHAVSDSIAAAHVSPEAAASGVAVQEKRQVENELLSSIPTTQSSGAPAPTVSAATSATAPDALVVGGTTQTPLTASSATGGKTTVTPLATGGLASNAGGLADPAVTKIVPESSAPTVGLNAPATAPTTTTAANPKPSAISRDVSPMTKNENQTQPLATTGVATGTTSATSGPLGSSAGPATTSGAVAPGATGASATKTAGIQNPALAAAQQASRNPTQVAPGSPSSTRTDESATSKSSKRRSFFGRLKDKVTSKKHEGGESSQN